MVETGTSEFPATKREKQQITVPFCWEEKPGRPKRDWRLNSAPSRPVPSSATTFAASVPFKWEEKPGTPLRQFAEEAVPTPLCTSLVYPASPSPGGYCKEDCKRSNPFVEGDVSIKTDVTVSPFDTEKSESNENPSEISGQCETWDSDSTSETGGGDSNYSGSATRKSGGDVSVLELLFPLSSPGVSFLNEVSWYREKANADTHLVPNMKNSKNQCVSVAKRGPTLGELIMLSRKLSRARQSPIPAEERKQGLTLVRWQEFVRKRVHACGLFGSSINQSITLDAS